MAQIVFPTNPVNGQVFEASNGVTYTWNESSGQWEASQNSATPYYPPSNSNGFGTRYVSTGSPTGGIDGDIWIQVES